ncbi:GGDEF domain-containing protein [Vibrio sp. CAU 1672]|uniref:GGDEF domain-containing protein n=1 Tax=Vibrio sp. CAU 1672 TaxID=3032594 RepID=UPI0023DC2CC4|nr:GGDEF domain-containing protein [Vibrio sp. CAU 1672]MDF2154521.1 GGDEF domain-containing protein [Vibrio sp. CAU 1672]
MVIKESDLKIWQKQQAEINCQAPLQHPDVYPIADNDEIIRRLKLENQRLRERVQQLEQRANRDYLTGLHNRAHCIETLNQLLMDASLKSIAVVFLDLDNLKQINDHAGHAMGDKALCHLAHTLRKQQKENCLIARFGGDEFVALLPNHSVAQAQRWCDELVERLAHLPYTSQEDAACHLSVSPGIYVYHRRDKTEEEAPVSAHKLIQLADQSMYQVKRAKKPTTGN